MRLVYVARCWEAADADELGLPVVIPAPAAAQCRCVQGRPPSAFGAVFPVGAMTISVGNGLARARGGFLAKGPALCWGGLNGI